MSQRQFGPAALVLALVLTACPATDDPYGSGGNTNGSKSNTGSCARCVGQSSGSGSGAGSTSGGSGSTGGTSVNCALVNPPYADGGCGAGESLLYAQALDLCATVMSPNRTHVPLAGATFGIDGCPSTTLSDATGVFNLCVPSEVDVSVSFAKTGYVSGDLGELQVTSNVGFLTSRGGIYLACTEALLAEESMAPAYESAKGAVLVAFVSNSNAFPCGRNDAGDPDLSGWRARALYTDGDAGPWPVIYLSSSVAPVNSGVTESPGYALVYNIDVPEIAIAVDRPMDDGGLVAQDCQPVSAQYGFSGRVRAPPTGFSYAPIVLP